VARCDCAFHMASDTRRARFAGHPSPRLGLSCSRRGLVFSLLALAVWPVAAGPWSRHARSHSSHALQVDLASYDEQTFSLTGAPCAPNDEALSAMPIQLAASDRDVRFYIWEEGAFNLSKTVTCFLHSYGTTLHEGALDVHMPPNLAEHTVDLALLSKLREHPKRTYDPDAADFHIIGAETEISFFTSMESVMGTECGGKWAHMQRMNWLAGNLSALPHFQAKGGRDFVLINSHYYKMSAVLGTPLFQTLRRNATLATVDKAFGNYQLDISEREWTGEYNRWSRQVIIPYRSMFSTEQATDAATGARPISSDSLSFMFRGNLERTGSGSLRGVMLDATQHLKGVSVFNEDFHFLNNESDGSPPYRAMTSITTGAYMNSTFCLVPAGDTATSRRLFDALASGCIPILLVDYPSMVGNLAFRSTIDWQSIAIFAGSLECVRDHLELTRKWLAQLLEVVSAKACSGGALGDAEGHRWTGESTGMNGDLVDEFAREEFSESGQQLGLANQRQDAEAGSGVVPSMPLADLSSERPTTAPEVPISSEETAERERARRQEQLEHWIGGGSAAEAEGEQQEYVYSDEAGQRRAARLAAAQVADGGGPEAISDSVKADGAPKVCLLEALQKMRAAGRKAFIDHLSYGRTGIVDALLTELASDPELQKEKNTGWMAKSIAVSELADEDKSSEGAAGADDTNLEFIHIPKNAGSTIEDAGFRYGYSWGRYKFTHCEASSLTQLSTESWRMYCENAPRLKLPCNRWHIPPAAYAFYEALPYKGKETFCVVRHPYAKVISEILYGAIMHPTSTAPCVGCCDAPALNERVKIMSAMLNQTLGQPWEGRLFYDGTWSPPSGTSSHDDCHWIPQTHYTNGPEYVQNGLAPKCDHVLRFENLEADWDELFAGRPSPVPSSALSENLANANGCGIQIGALNAESQQMIADLYRDDFAAFGYSTDIAAGDQANADPESLRHYKGGAKVEVLTLRIEEAKRRIEEGKRRAWFASMKRAKEQRLAAWSHAHAQTLLSSLESLEAAGEVDDAARPPPATLEDTGKRPLVRLHASQVVTA